MSAMLPQAAGEILPDGQPVRFDSPSAAQHAGIFAVYQTINLISGRSMAETARCVTP
jgi:monosaccharide-transporting ATPase